MPELPRLVRRGLLCLHALHEPAEKLAYFFVVAAEGEGGVGHRHNRGSCGAPSTRNHNDAWCWRDNWRERAFHSSLDDEEVRSDIGADERRLP